MTTNIEVKDGKKILEKINVWLKKFEYLKF